MGNVFIPYYFLVVYSVCISSYTAIFVTVSLSFIHVGASEVFGLDLMKLLQIDKTGFKHHRVIRKKEI